MGRRQQLEEEVNKPVELVENIAKNIEQIASGVRHLLGGRLQQRTVEILLVHSTKLPRSQVREVLEVITKLDKNFLK